ncbi:MAG TPA: hypothetical protein VM536_05405 [Chloroflexia bacterium]|nr:hypothetical protein [Chloroflexia bacterium]
MEVLMEVLAGLAVLAAFDLAALRWGVSSREEVDHAEWQRRRTWRGFAVRGGQHHN